jgi:hypothetical protein
MVATPSVAQSDPRAFNSKYYQPLTVDAECLAPLENASLSNPHSSAFLDLDGDCMPDLFLTKSVYDELGQNVTSVIYEIYHQMMVYS